MDVVKMKLVLSFHKLLAPIVCLIMFSGSSFAAPTLTPDMITIINPSVMGSGKADLKALMKQRIIENHQSIFETDNIDMQQNPIIVEFFDYTCGHCKNMARRIAHYINKHPKITLILKEFPIRGPQARFAARAALASKHQSKYMIFHKKLMDFKGITNHAVMEQAKKINLDVTKLKQDMQKAETYQTISNNYSLAKSLKVTGTPTFLLYGQDKQNKPHITFISGELNEAELDYYLYGIGNIY